MAKLDRQVCVCSHVSACHITPCAVTVLLQLFAGLCQMQCGMSFFNWQHTLEGHECVHPYCHTTHTQANVAND